MIGRDHVEVPTVKSTMYAQALGNSQLYNPMAQMAQNALSSNLFQEQQSTGQPWHASNSAGWEKQRHDKLEQLLRDSLELEEEKAKPMQIDTRLVKVFIVDPTDSLLVNDRLLYKSDEILTDKTDQELYFDIDIKDILTKHNEKRVKTEDKRRKDNPDGKMRYLEPARVRDLKMQVVVLAQF